MAEQNNGNYLINVPDIGEGIAEVEIVEWPLNIGDDVREDDVICVVMTDKATVEIPSPVDGKITWFGAEPGEMMSVGAKLIGLDIQSEVNITESPEPEVIQPRATEPQKTLTQPIIPSTRRVGIPRHKGGKPIASPAVKQRARNAGIDLHFVEGTGRAHRITHSDLDLFISEQSHPGDTPAATTGMDTRVDEIKVIGLRRKIATVMQDTMQRIPHFTYVEEVDVSELESLRNKLNRQRGEDQPKLTVLPFIIKAMVKAIKLYPEMSSRFDDEKNIVHQYGAAHIGIATQTESGLVVPVVKHAEAMDIWQSAAEIKRLSTSARGGNATREELNGSTITITSLGPIGGIVTTPVINSPEVAIVGINKIAKRPVWQDGAFTPRDIMNISSSFDHRIIDGWEATLFIQQIKNLLESPAMLFMED